jgi:hypothetical protein
MKSRSFRPNETRQNRSMISAARCTRLMGQEPDRVRQSVGTLLVVARAHDEAIAKSDFQQRFGFGGREIVVIGTS